MALDIIIIFSPPPFQSIIDSAPCLGSDVLCDHGREPQGLGCGELKGTTRDLPPKRLLPPNTLGVFGTELDPTLETLLAVGGGRPAWPCICGKLGVPGGRGMPFGSIGPGVDGGRGSDPARVSTKPRPKWLAGASRPREGVHCRELAEADPATPPRLGGGECTSHMAS